MNRNKILLSTCILLFAWSAQAQIRHVKGIRSVDLFYLHSRFGSGGGVSYVKYFSSSFYGKGSVLFEQGEDSGLSYRSIGGDLTVAKNIVHSGHRYYLNGIGGVTLSVDAVTKGGEQFNISNEFKTGAFAGIENELFLSDRLVLVLSWSQRVLINQAFGNYRWHAQAALRFNL